jgi:hypothetical protein
METEKLAVVKETSNEKHFKLQGTKNSSLLDSGCKVQQSIQKTLCKLLQISE